MTNNNKSLQPWPLQNSQLLEEVYGSNKSRDMYILERLAEGILGIDIAQEVGLDNSRITQIARDNRTLLDKLTFTTRFSSKAGRLRLAFKCLQGRISSKKDTIEILDYVRKELEGDVQFKQQINQFIGVKDEDLDTIILQGLNSIEKLPEQSEGQKEE